MTSPIVVIGDALLDVRVAASGARRRGGDVPARIDLGPGGQGANVAVRLARRGIDVELVCGLGDDPAGAIIRTSLEADGVTLRAVDALASGTVVVLAEADGERTMLSQRLPFAHQVGERVAAAAASWLVVSGYLLAEPAPVQLVRAAAASPARRVVLGCALSSRDVAGWLAAARAVRPDLVVLNRDEMERLGTADGLGTVVVTAADAATVLTADGARFVIDAPPGPGAVDTTGAGDAFAAGLVGSLDGCAWPPTRDELERAAADGIALAGLVARVHGAQARVESEPQARMRA